ncbi:MAG TPA: alpha-glucuronidase family glycosyl hydrolase [Steroidobacteraceae bacterium]|nr:alpha-glucuronidase family glycosyl hydrolase [Steroidobacteraceae bacterium]
MIFPPIPALRGPLLLLLAAIGAGLPAVAAAEDGYRLWLRYTRIASPAREAYAARATGVVAYADSATLRAAVAELDAGLAGMLGKAPAAATAVADGNIVLATASGSPQLAARAASLGLAAAGSEGFVLRSTRWDGHPVTLIAANTDTGVLYGVFRYLALMQRRESMTKLDVHDAPRLKLRVLDHWDNPDRSVERGYAGQSIFDFWRLPGYVDPRYTDYARADASVGINGVVLNNVAASSVYLTSRWIAKVAAIAQAMRPYGIRVYLSVQFNSPLELGETRTGDPRDPSVIAWWHAKADEIYRAIPDFGGFLVKADSEGQPGPRDYHLTQAQGANMIAGALAAHGGVVMWRAFVYATENAQDRVRQAYAEFKPLDGQFADNVLVQIKNGPLDFQPREPVHPLFGAMPATQEMPEFQLTKEYLGFSTHLVYLGALFAEVLRWDTFAHGAGSTVARVIEGPRDGHALTGMAGVANIGTDRDWTGSIFGQADWYAFGRLAWDPQADPQAIAGDWVRMTFSGDPRVVRPIVGMMMGSREAVVDYMTPLGLAHLMATGHHYGPGPWIDNLPRAEWNPVYYHHAGTDGIGFDRTASGSDALADYAPEVARRLADPDVDDDRYLLWFHHVPWSFRVASGRTVWEELTYRYSRGVATVQAMGRTWDSLRPFIDAERFGKTAAFLREQHEEARWWRDACIAYFQSKAGLPLPPGITPPQHPLAWYEEQVYRYAPGRSRSDADRGIAH